MPVSTINTQKKSPYLKVAIYLLALVGIGLIVYFGGSLIKNFGFIKGRSELAADVLNGKADVYLNDKLIGQTPIAQFKTTSGENTLKIKNAMNEYSTKIKFMPNSEVVSVQDLGISSQFSSGRNFWLEESSTGNILTIQSNPTGAKVYLDNNEVGTTPYSTKDLSDGEYDLRVDFPGYESQTARIKVQQNYNLNVDAKLFPMPVPTKVNEFEGSKGLYAVVLDDPAITTNTASWVKAILYWNQTRGINLAGLGQNRDLVFDYFIDYNGSLYDAQANLVADIEAFKQTAKKDKGAYLGRISDGEGVTAAAAETVTKLGGSSITAGDSSKKITILDTGNGTATSKAWLRVRSEPSTAGSEVTKVNAGEEYAVLEEQTGWVKIKVSDSLQGWVSATYTKAVAPTE